MPQHVPVAHARAQESERRDGEQQEHEVTDGAGGTQVVRHHRRGEGTGLLRGEGHDQDDSSEDEGDPKPVAPAEDLAEEEGGDDRVRNHAHAPDGRHDGGRRVRVAVRHEVAHLATHRGQDAGPPDRHLDEAGLGILAAQPVRAGVTKTPLRRCVPRALLHLLLDAIVRHLLQREADRDDDVAEEREEDAPGEAGLRPPGSLVSLVPGGARRAGTQQADLLHSAHVDGRAVAARWPRARRAVGRREVGRQ